MKQFNYRPTPEGSEALESVPIGLRNKHVDNAVCGFESLVDALEALVDKRDGAQQVARLLLRRYKRSDIRHFQKP